MKNFLLVCLLLRIIAANGQSTSAYQIYNSKGKRSSVNKLLKSASASDYVFFGEYHDDPIAHWLEFEVLKSAYSQRKRDVIVSFEMFEQDQQQLMDDYLSGIHDDTFFEDSCRLWPNYETDYKPLLKFAKDSGLVVVAANTPRMYASILYKNGRSALDSLSEEEKLWIAPLDFVVDSTLSQYAQINEMGKHMGSSGGYLMEAQAFKDATMAHFIDKYGGTNKLVVHYVGAYHTDFYQGIIWYLEQKRGELNKITISTVRQKDINQLDSEHKGRADFIICVDEDITRTH